MNAVKLGDICNFYNGGAWSQNEFTEAGYPVLKVSNCKSNGFEISDVSYIPYDIAQKSKINKLQIDDVIIATVGSHPNLVESAAGRSCVVTTAVVGFYLNQNAVCLRSKDPNVFSQKYLGYLAASAPFKHYIQSRGKGAANQMRIAISAIKDFSLVLPDIEVQKAVGTILSAYDDLIENNQKQIKLLEEAAQRLYKEWFVDLRFPGHENTKITDGVPEGWRKYKFSDTTSIMGGGTPKTDVKEFYNGNIPFYTPKDSDDSFFAFDTITHISQSGLDNCNSQLYPVNTIIITARGTVGKTTILAVPMAMNQSCYALKCDELNSPYYLFFSLKNEVAALKTMSNGGVFNTIIVKTFDSICLIAPTQDVLNMFEASVSPIMEQIKTKARQNIILTEARDRLLPKLMSGEIEL